MKIIVFGGVQALVRIDMTMPSAPRPEEGGEISQWEKQAYGDGGRFGSMTSIPSGDPSKDKINVDLKGCAYNVAKDLASKGHEVAFMGVVGDDALGKAALADLGDSGVDTSRMAVSDHMTSVRVEARNFLGDLEFWRVDESIQDDLTPAKAMEMMAHTVEADIAFADGSLPAETLKAIGKILAEKGVEFFFDPASLEGAAKGSECLEYFTGIMPGRREAELMSGLQILSADEMREAARFFESKGIEKVFITIKGGGIYYGEGDAEGTIRPERVLQFAETGGAGDVVTACLVDAFAGGASIEDAARAGMEAAAEHLSDVVDEREY